MIEKGGGKWNILLLLFVRNAVRKRPFLQRLKHKYF